jgi:hypothetical protein
MQSYAGDADVSSSEGGVWPCPAALLSKYRWVYKLLKIECRRHTKGDHLTLRVTASGVMRGTRLSDGWQRLDRKRDMHQTCMYDTTSQHSGVDIYSQRSIMRAIGPGVKQPISAPSPIQQHQA